MSRSYTKLFSGRTFTRSSLITWIHTSKLLGSTYRVFSPSHGTLSQTIDLIKLTFVMRNNVIFADIIYCQTWSPERDCWTPYFLWLLLFVHNKYFDLGLCLAKTSIVLCWWSLFVFRIHLSHIILFLSLSKPVAHWIRYVVITSWSIWIMQLKEND